MIDFSIMRSCKIRIKGNKKERDEDG